LPARIAGVRAGMNDKPDHIVIAGLVPAISLIDAQRFHRYGNAVRTYRDRRDKPGDDAVGKMTLHPICPNESVSPSRRPNM
jgi:hypothetical protein